MAGSFSNYAENALLEEIVGKTAYALPTTFIALCTASPTDAGTGASCNETSGTSYARVATAGLWAAASGGSITNASDITFPTAGGSWGTVTHWALIDNQTVGQGNMLAWGSLDVSQVIANGNTVVFPAGSLIITLD